MYRFASVLLIALPLAGCAEHPMLRNLPPDAPVAEYTVQIPEGYEVRSVGFGAAYDTSVSGGGGIGTLALPVSGSSSQQPYVHVHVVERATGQHVLLVYADIRRRTEPVALIRLEPGESLRLKG
jgi:hypothetical protein